MAFPDNIVPGNLRQQFIPFVLSPSDAINKGDIKSKQTGVKPQVFSFRKKDVNENTAGLLNIYPNDRGCFNNDIGIKLMASYHLYENGGNGKTDLQKILDNAPGIQIREYTQDLKIDLIWDLVKNCVNGFQDGEDAASNPKDIDKKLWTARVAATIEALKQKGFWKGFGDSIKEKVGVSEQYPSSNSWNNMFVVTLVKALYYNMIGSTATNYYILPCNNDELFNTNGSDGWGNNNGLNGIGTSKNGIFGTLLNFIGSNIKIKTQPIWNGNSDSPYGGISITFNLFNDTRESAVSNFIFVNTIFPQNMFLQYNVFQQPPSTYDIKIEGGRRWFMCSGDFKCKNLGVLRKPTKKFIEKLISSHLNKEGSIPKTITADFLYNNDVIKIPDAYEVTLDFKSLLPDNFNNYIFQYSMNNNILDKKESRQEAFYNEGNQYIEKQKIDVIERIAQEASGQENEQKAQQHAVMSTKNQYSE